MMSEHSPLPWKIVDNMLQAWDGEFVTYTNGVCDEETWKPNGELIVKAVNSYESKDALLRELVEAVAEIHKAMESQFGNPLRVKKLGDLLRRAREAVKASGKGL